ncbi:MAG TPA: hypothetical protein PLU72_17700 [Candidatus Ozemobacteraceae bacterium]|nr:hypothetical protein [Candidatus Ozemobacteraceae bacterium]
MAVLRLLDRAAYMLLIAVAISRSASFGAWILAALIAVLIMFRWHWASEVAWLPDRLLLSLPLFWAMERIGNVLLLELPVAPLFGGMIVLSLVILASSRTPETKERISPELEWGILLALIFQLGISIALCYLTDQYPSEDFLKLLWLTAAFFGAVPISYAVFSIGSEAGALFPGAKSR